MLKIRENFQVKEGTEIYLTEEWHEKILKALKIKEYPYQFIVKEKKRISSGRELKYVCESISQKKQRKVYNLVLSSNIIKYYFGTEVPDTNIGFSFKEYLPLENTDILITNIRNISVVQPAFFHVVVNELILEDGTKLPYLDFQIDYKNGDAFTSLNYYTEVNRATWKFLFNPDTSYMTDYEKMFQDTFIHKRYVENSCKKLAKYLEESGAKNHARLLIERGKVHDNSKIKCEDELRALSMIINDKSNMKDANVSLSPLKQDSIKLHHKHNTHHPEHYESCMDMTKLDIMEMVCDWHARSTQLGTDFLKYVVTAQKNRFHFPEWMFCEIYHYCEILNRE